jgi:predicted AlkP superfamily pyrophosphatase or phosphodiesterase
VGIGGLTGRSRIAGGLFAGRLGFSLIEATKVIPNRVSRVCRTLDAAGRLADYPRMRFPRPSRFLRAALLGCLLVGLIAVGRLAAQSRTSDAGRKTPATSAPARRAPKLVVILVVDQMRADYVEKFGATWTGGLRRLMSDGAWFREAAYPYATTVTCAGHSTIATGSLPATHGIVSNAWWDRDTGKALNCVADPEQSLVSYGEPPKAPGGTSTRNLRVPTLADEMRAQMPVAPRIVSISLKDYTATTMAGRKADAATWFNPSLHSWMTTTAFTKTPVPFVAEFVEKHPVEADYGKSWTKLLPDAAYLYPDDAPGENTDTWTRTFPHVLRGKGVEPDAAYYVQWDKSPYSDAYLGAMAEYAVDVLKMGQGAGTDYLAVSFSALDMVGHDFGPRSQEVQDILAHLDRTIGSLMDHLDRNVGKGQYILSLVADHGVAPIPEQMTALGLSAGRVVISDVVTAVDKALEPFLGPGKHVARIASGDLYFVPGDWEKIVASPAALRAVIDRLRATPGVARVFRGDQLGDLTANSEDRLERAVSWSYFPGRSGDLIVVLRPYWQSASSATTAEGTGHGMPYDYDQRVPMFLFGRGIKPGQHLNVAGPMDIAPTFAFLCGITLPGADGRVLNETLEPLAAPGATANR